MGKVSLEPAPPNATANNCSYMLLRKAGLSSASSPLDPAVDTTKQLARRGLTYPGRAVQRTFLYTVHPLSRSYMHLSDASGTVSAAPKPSI